MLEEKTPHWKIDAKMCQNRSKTEFGHQMGLEVPNFDDLDAIRYSFSQGIRSRHSRARCRPFWDRKRPNHENMLKPKMPSSENPNMPSPWKPEYAFSMKIIRHARKKIKRETKRKQSIIMVTNSNIFRWKLNYAFSMKTQRWRPCALLRLRAPTFLERGRFLRAKHYWSPSPKIYF